MKKGEPQKWLLQGEPQNCPARQATLGKSLIELGLLQTGWESPHIPFVPVVGDAL